MENNYIDPIWKRNPCQIEWHFYIGLNTRSIWNTFDHNQKLALYNDAVKLGNERMSEHYKNG